MKLEASTHFMVPCTTSRSLHPAGALSYIKERHGSAIAGRHVHSINVKNPLNARYSTDYGCCNRFHNYLFQGVNTDVHGRVS